ncbi:MlaD family protein [Nocardia thailandica]|uniref:MlaD family protein n=1 Tax=Nocardia thailandica TaxID=257275 RepID=UPI0002FBED2B|nr:MlaD family protein [Nocardia thailandica]
MPPPYTLPGTEVGPWRARILGACAVLLTLAGVTAWQLRPDTTDPGDIRVVLRTEHVGAGVRPGTDVRLSGVRVGTVDDIAPAGDGREDLTLVLRRADLYGLTDRIRVEFAPDNLFGITTLRLVPGAGGTELADGATVDLGGDAASRVSDATLSALLRSTGELTDEVLTTKLAELLHTVSGDLRAFSPLLQAVGATVRAYADTRQRPVSDLVAAFGSVLAGTPPMLTGAVDVLNAAYTNEYLRSPDNLARFATFWDDMQYQLLPMVTRTMTTADTHFGGVMPMATTILNEVATTVGPPGRSAELLTLLLDRLGAAFVDTPAGPVLRVSAELDVVPGLAAPLRGVLGTAAVQPGGR